MRIAVKYSMDDIQVAITKVILIPPKLRTEISRLAFVAEFPSQFSKELAIKVFIDASSITYDLTADDVQPLMVHPDFIGLMMQYREGRAKPDRAIWERSYYCEPLGGGMRAMDAQMWLNQQFTSFGFKPLGWSADEHGDSLPPIQGLHAHFGTPQGDATPVAVPTALPDDGHPAASTAEGALQQHQHQHQHRHHTIATATTATGGGGYTSSSSTGRGGRHHLPEPDAEGFVNTPTKRPRGGGGEHREHRGGRGRGERGGYRGRGGEWRGGHRGGVPGGAGEGVEYGSGGEQGDRPRGGGWRGRDRGGRGGRGEGGRGEYRDGRGRGEWRGRNDGYRGGEHRGRGEERGGSSKLFSKVRTTC